MTAPEGGSEPATPNIQPPSVAVEDLQDILSAVVHDLGAPLRAMDGFSALLTANYPENLTHKQRQLLTRIHRATGAMQQKLSALAHFQTVTRLSPEAQWVSARELRDHALKKIPGSPGSKVIELADNCPDLLLDPETFSEALAQPINNALCLLQSRGEEPLLPGAIQISAYTPLANEPMGQGLVIVDRGPGISAKNPQMLFKLFRQGDPPSGESGLGLTLVRWIARQHGGDCWIRSSRPCAIVLLAQLTDC